MGSKPQVSPVAATSPCIARQPILTEDESVIGYELFFREDKGERRFHSDHEKATFATIDTLNLVGLGVLCDNRLAFINCAHHTLLTEYFFLLPADSVVVEIQESVPAAADVIQACQRLKKAGYAIALDNFVTGDEREALTPYADFVKVDVTRVPPMQCAALANTYAGPQRLMLAHKVETRQQFLTASKAGFKRFQGYFFHHPENIQVRQIPPSQVTNLRLLSAVSKTQVEFEEIENLIKHDAPMCYRLLRYLNSPLLGLSSPVHSVRNALNLLGEKETVRWVQMATTLVMAQEKSSDLMLASLVRARFCELIAPRVEKSGFDLFLMGMLSLIDAILAVPMGLVLEDLSLDPAIKNQLLAARTGTRTPLSTIYDLMLAREAGDWAVVTSLGKQLNLSLSFVAESSNAAMRWAHDVSNAVQPPAK